MGERMEHFFGGKSKQVVTEDEIQLPHPHPDPDSDPKTIPKVDAKALPSSMALPHPHWRKQHANHKYDS